MNQSTSNVKEPMQTNKVTSAPSRRAGNTNGRPADRKIHLVKVLRQQIIRGDFAPGSRLPTRVEIEQESGFSSDTVQSALSDLRRDGFIEVRGRNGTFVASQLPHLTRYALAFSVARNSTSWNHHWTALSSEAEGIASEHGLDLTIYYDVYANQNSNDYRRLAAEAAAHRVAGIIFAYRPSFCQNAPLLSEPDIPYVAISAPNEECGFEIPTVNTNIYSFFERAIKELKERGCKRIAFLFSAAPNSEAIENFCRTQVESLGLETRPYWWQRVSLHDPCTAKQLTHLLLHDRQSERPDGFIIADDNLVEYATAGVISSGMKVPDELQIIAHCNFPWTTPSLLPVQRLGFDVRTVLEKCIDCIDRQRANQPVKPVEYIEPLFEWEIGA